MQARRRKLVLTGALSEAIRARMEDGVTTPIEAMINQELGEPFRRDARTNLVAVMGIDAGDMQPRGA